MTFRGIAERFDVRDCDLAGSVFRDVKLAGADFVGVNLAGATIRESRLDGMTIDGILVTDLLATYATTRYPHEPSENRS